MPGTRRVIGTTDHRWHDRSPALDLQQWLNERALGQLHSVLSDSERAVMFNFLARHVLRFFPANLAVFWHHSSATATRRIVQFVWKALS